MASETLDLKEIRCLDVDLAEKLEIFVGTLTATQPTMSNFYAELIARLERTRAGEGAPDISQPMPPFLLPDCEGRLMGSDDLLAAGPLVISFNRGHWCEFCQLELLAMSEIHPEVRRLGGEVISITPDRAAVTRQWRIRDHLPFPILTDLDCGYALACGLMIALGPAVRDLYKSAGIDLPTFQGNGAYFVPIPATYVIARTGVVAARFVAANFQCRMSPEAILEALRQLCEDSSCGEP